MAKPELLELADLFDEVCAEIGLGEPVTDLDVSITQVKGDPFLRQVEIAPPETGKLEENDPVNMSIGAFGIALYRYREQSPGSVTILGPDEHPKQGVAALVDVAVADQVEKVLSID